MSIYLGDKKLAGSVKLYSGTGQNTDGAMTQKATTDALNGKANIGASYTKAESDGLLENKASTSLSNITADGKEIIAHQAMPSDRYVNLTLGASGSSYTAPADGYFIIDKATTANNQRVGFYKEGGISNIIFGPTGVSLRSFVPVKKGDSVLCVYDADGTTNYFRFIYANGAQ